MARQTTPAIENHFSDDPFPVPKIVMQTWKTADVPEKWKPGFASVDKHLAKNGWHHVLLTDVDNDAFVREHFPWFHETFSNLPYGIQRADAIRYCYLYVHGGMYMDLDMELLSGKRLENELRKAAKSVPTAEVFVVRSSNVHSSFTNSFMASKPKSEVWLRALRSIQQNPNGAWWSVGKHMKVMSSTGPTMLTKVLRKTHPKRVAEIPSKLILPCSIFDMEVKCRGKTECSRPDSIMKTLRGQSWNASDSNFWNYCQCYGPSVAVVVGFILFVLLLFAILQGDWTLIK